MNQPKLAFSLTEFADAHGISRTSVYNEIRAGRLVISKVGRRSLVTAEHAAAWRDSLPSAIVDQQAA